MREKYIYYLVFLVYGFVSGGFYFSIIKPIHPQIVHYIPSSLIIKENHDSLTKENILWEMNRAKIQHPEIVFNQIRLETSNLKCTNCSLDYNNLFGFMMDSTYLTYDTWMLSISAYKFWQKKRYKDGDYYDCLRKYWKCSDIDLYICELKKMK